MKAIDIRELSIEDIQAKIEQESAQYEKLRISHKISPVENPIQLRHSRRSIARLHSILTEKITKQS